MGAVEFIKKHVKITDILQHYGKQVRNKRCSCIIHGGDNNTAFVINDDDTLYYCHTNCGGGDIYDLIMGIEHITFTESIYHIANIFKLDIDNMEIQARKNMVLEDTLKWIATMQNMVKQIPLKEFDVTVLGELYPINSYRHFDKHTLEHFNIKYCTANKRIVVPIYANKTLIGVTMRKTTTHPAKWVHQPSGLLTGHYLFNLDNIEKGKPLILVEGVWDVLNYYINGYKNVVASFGCHLTAEQERLILQSTYDLCISYDSDSAGKRGTNNIIKRLANKINIHIARIQDNKDAGELSKDEIINAIENQYTIQEWRRAHANS